MSARASASAPSMISAAIQSNTPRKASRMNSTEAAIITTKLLRVSCSAVCITAISAGMPSTNRMFAVFDPTTLPSAIPGTPDMAAWTEISNSGADVPKATMVRLTISAGIPILRARFTAPFTSASPANNRITSPRAAINQTIVYPFRCPQEHGPRPMR